MVLFIRVLAGTRTTGSRAPWTGPREGPEQHVPRGVAFISQGLLLPAWNVCRNMENESDNHQRGGKTRWHCGKVPQLVHVAPRFVLVRKRDEKEIFRNYCFILAEIGNTWARGTGFFCSFHKRGFA